jgi:hypothetical protein
MRALFLISLFAASTSAAPVHVAVKDIVGDWVSLRGCSDSLYKFSANGEYHGYCFDTIESGRWSLRDGDKILITYYDAKNSISTKSRRSTMTITGFQPHSDRTFMYGRSQGGEDKWMK